MNPIDALFRQLRSTGRKAFMPFLTAGDPDLGFTSRLLPQVVEAGADLIEVGFPFSDPIADGPTIQASYTRALEGGVKLDGIFEALAKTTSAPNWSAPLAGMVSYSLIHRRGPKTFIVQAKKAGLSGAVVPDLPAEEADDFAKLAADNDFKLILLVTPTTPPARAERIVKLCTGFLYCVSIVGITGEREHLPDTLQQQLHRLRDMTELPLCVGFGVSKPAHVRQLKEIADGVIVGSAIVRRLENGDSAGICQVVRELSAELHRESTGLAVG